MEEEEVTPAPAPETTYQPGQKGTGGYTFLGKDHEGNYRYGHVSGEIVTNTIDPKKYFSYFKATTREQSPQQKKFEADKAAKTARVLERADKNKKLRAVVDKIRARKKAREEATLAIDKQLPGETEKVKKVLTQDFVEGEEAVGGEAGETMRDRIVAIRDNPSLTPEEKKQKLFDLGVSPASIEQAPIPPAPDLSSPESGYADPGPWQGGTPTWEARQQGRSVADLMYDPKGEWAQAAGQPGAEVHTEYTQEGDRKSEEAARAEKEHREIQADADNQAYFHSPGTQFIEGAKVSHGRDPEGRAIKSFMDPVDTPAARGMLAMQQAYEAETGKKLYISRGQATVEEQMIEHGLKGAKGRKIAESGQHVKKNAYDIFMAPNPADGHIFKNGKKYLTGHQLTEEYQWMQANAARFGFVNTMPIDKKSGRKEYWHWEFTGAGGSAAMPPAGKVKEARSLESFQLAKTADAALQGISDDYANAAYSQQNAAGVVDVQRKHNAETLQWEEAKAAEYKATSDLEAKQKAGALELAKKKQALAEYERKGEERELVIEEEQATMQEAWKEEALLQGYDRFAEVNKEIDAIREKEISPWSMFGFWKEDAATGEETWDVGKSAFTIGAGLALLANFAATIGSATSKKGKQIPFLVYDMLNDAITADTKGQIASINRDFKAIDKKAAAYKDIMAVVKGQKAFEEKSRLDKIRMIRKSIAIEKAKVTELEHKNILAEFDLKWEQQEKATYAAYQSAILEPLRKNADFNISAIQVEDQRIDRLREVHLNGIIRLSMMREKQDQKKTKLTRTQEEHLTTARSLLPLASEIEGAWDRVGGDQKTLWKWSHAILPTDWFPGWARSEEWDDLSKLENIRETIAAKLAKMMGDTGNIALQEAERGMNQLPYGDPAEIGRWKVLRFKQRVMLAASRRYQLLDDDAKRQFGQLILDMDPGNSGKIENIEKQTKAYQDFLDADSQEAWLDLKSGGHGAPKPRSIRSSLDIDRDVEATMGAADRKAQEIRKGQKVLSDRQAKRLGGNTGNQKRARPPRTTKGRTQGEALEY